MLKGSPRQTVRCGRSRIVNVWARASIGASRSGWTRISKTGRFVMAVVGTRFSRWFQLGTVSSRNGWLSLDLPSTLRWPADALGRGGLWLWFWRLVGWLFGFGFPDAIEAQSVGDLGNGFSDECLHHSSRSFRWRGRLAGCGAGPRRQCRPWSVSLRYHALRGSPWSCRRRTDASRHDHR